MKPDPNEPDECSPEAQASSYDARICSGMYDQIVEDDVTNRNEDGLSKFQEDTITCIVNMDDKSRYWSLPDIPSSNRDEETGTGMCQYLTPASSRKQAVYANLHLNISY